MPWCTRIGCDDASGVMQWVWAATALLTVAVAVAVCYRPLGDHMVRVFTSDKHWRVELWLYRLVGADPDHQQRWTAYFRDLLLFSGVGLAMLYVVQRVQAWLPYNLGLPNVSPDSAFNTAASFVANTNWQSYSPEHTMGFTVQMLGLTVQSFVSAGVGLAVAIALVRSIAARGTGVVGNFFVDVMRANLRLLLPASILATVVLVAAGAVQNLTGFTDITTVAGSSGVIPGGPVASQEAIKILGTNGGGFFNANSAHPFENPSAWANLFQTFLLIVIPFASLRAFGKMVGDLKLARSILATMIVLFTVAYAFLTLFELSGGGDATRLAGAAMEGKEQRFGIIGST
ncbi:MAG: potassium-transporting ATPase subunit KdpA, partial [Propionibacteriaceae bacterium]|nr:potassium-transporting ATPase subunit KdpA [Propionibacteriaceae bacterium]